MASRFVAMPLDYNILYQVAQIGHRTGFLGGRITRGMFGGSFSASHDVGLFGQALFCIVQAGSSRDRPAALRAQPQDCSGQTRQQDEGLHHQ